MAELNYYWVKDDEGEEPEIDTLYLAHSEQEAIEICFSKELYNSGRICGIVQDYTAGIEFQGDEAKELLCTYDAPSLYAKKFMERAESIVTPIWNGLPDREKEDFWNLVHENAFYFYMFSEPFLYGNTWHEDERRLITNISALIKCDYDIEKFTSWNEVLEAVDNRVNEICEPFSYSKVEDLNKNIVTQLQKLSH